MKTVSIIIPVYNTAEYIEECIQSVLEQTYKHIELIVIDDFSTDHSYEILRKLEQEHDQIKLFKFKNLQKNLYFTKNIYQIALDLHFKFISFFTCDLNSFV